MKYLFMKSLVLFVLALGVISGSVFAFTEPTQAPPGGNVVGPLTTGTSAQWRNGPLGIGTAGVPSGTLLLDVEGNVGAVAYCDQDGNNCTLAANLGGGGGGTGGKFVDGDDANDAVYTLGNVGVGLTNPGYTFDVNGDINFAGDLYKNGVLFTGGATQIDELTDAQKNTTYNNLFLGHAGFSGTYHNDLNVGVGVGTLDNPNTDDSEVYYGDANTALGYYALTNNTSGYYNAAQGAYTLSSNTTGNYNAAQGSHAMRYNTTGIRNAAQGAYALYANVTGSYNTAQGVNVLRSNIAGNNNVAQGYSALYFNTASNNTAQGTDALRANTTASNNTAQGYRALYSNTTGESNTAQGVQVLRANVTGSYNTGSGALALYSNTTGSDNVATGSYVLFSNTTGSQNTAVGESALSANTTGSANTSIGATTLYNNTTGDNNVAVGGSALYANTTGYQNTAVGKEALNTNTTGYLNTAIGAAALLANTTGIHNTASGVSALTNNTTGVSNVANGFNSLRDNTTGNYNSGFGIHTLLHNTIGSHNTAGGSFALRSNTTGSQNTAIGDSALYDNVTGGDNTAVGTEALNDNTTGSQNTAIGFSALYSNGTGGENTAVGTEALNANTTGERNTTSGRSSMYSNTTGSYNTVQGVDALANNTTGSYNTVQGMSAFFTNTTGSHNVAIGNDAGNYISDSVTANETGDNNVFLGTYTKALADGDTNEIVIGYDATGNGSNSVTIGDDSITKTILKGGVGIGTNSLSAGLKLDVEGKVGATEYCDQDGNNCTPATSLGGSGKFVDGTDPNDAVYTLGKVGIGTTSPGAKLHIASMGTPIELTETDQTGAGSLWRVVLDAKKLRFDASQDGSTFLPYKTPLLMTKEGYVGIGTTTPGAKLEVWGPALFSSNTGAGDSWIPNTNGEIYLTGNEDESGTGDINFRSYSSANGYTQRVIIKGNGNVGIGTTSPGYKLDVRGPVRMSKNSTYGIWIQGGSAISGDARNLAILGHIGQDRLYIGYNGEYDYVRLGPSQYAEVYAGGWKPIYAGAFYYGSDRRLKKNIKDLENSADILKITPKRFDWKKSSEYPVAKGDVGVIAQDVEVYFPEFVDELNNGMKAVNYPKLVVPLIGVVKKQQQDIEELREEVSALQEQVQALMR